MKIDGAQILKSEIGETVLAPTYPKKVEGLPQLDIVYRAGWHNVNNLYGYDRPDGIKHFLLLFTVSGEGSAYIENQTFELTAGSVLIIPPSVSSGYHTDDKTWEFYWLHIDGENASNILTFLINHQYLLDISHTNIIRYIKQILAPNCSLSERYIYSAKLVSKILFEMIYLKNQNGAPENDIIDELVCYLEQENTQINLTEFAANHYVSVQNLIRIFFRRIGETPYSYHRAYKMAKAAQRLVYTKTQIKTIAAVAGYCSEGAFSTQFSKLYGLSPSEYRNRYKVYQN